MKKLLLGLILPLTLWLGAGASLTLIRPQTVLAADSLTEVCSSGEAQNSSVCQERNKEDDPIIGPNGVLTRVIQILVFIIGIAAVIMIIINGLRYIISNGDTNAVNSAKNGIIYALIGLVVAILAQSIVSFVLNRL